MPEYYQKVRFWGENTKQEHPGFFPVKEIGSDLQMIAMERVVI